MMISMDCQNVYILYGTTNIMNYKIGSIQIISCPYIYPITEIYTFLFQPALMQLTQRVHAEWLMMAQANNSTRL